MFKNLCNRKKKNNKGFSLVELVIVVAIMAILVGILAPQYTKYVERSRKAADATNLDEMVKAVKVYAADPVTELPAGTYKITILKGEGGVDLDDTDDGKIKAAIEDAIPDYASRKLKSQKWGEDGAAANISAEIEITEEGGTIVKYEPPKFAEYMANGADTSKDGGDGTK